jgi:iron complex outermembrane receptor protein
MRIQRIGSRSALFAASAAWALLLPWAATEAQVAAGANGTPAPEEKLEEITVTARRRAENLQTVPIAVTVVTQQKLQDNNIQTIGDLQYLVPSMSAGAVSTRDAVNVLIRGQGANAFGGQPGVVSYLNEVPLPVDSLGSLAGGPGLFFDLQNVQVLKGPQGTLFGRNSTGGALLLESARPTNEFGGSLQLGYGNYNNREVDGAVNLPIIDEKLLVRLAFNGQKRDGFTHLLADAVHPDGIDGDNRDFDSFRGTVAFHPTEWLQNDTIVSYSNFNSNGNPFILTAVNPKGLLVGLSPSALQLFAEQQSLGVRTAIPINGQDQSSGVNLALDNISNIELSDGVTFRNIFGYDESRRTVELDNDATALAAVASPSTPAATKSHQYTEEAQLHALSFDKRLDWMVGGFYLRKPDNDYVRTTQNIYGAKSDSVTAAGTESKALFAQGSYDLSALVTGLKFTAGARETWDDISGYTRGAVPGTPAVFCGYPPVNCSYVTTTAVKSRAPTWTAGFDYQVESETLLYLTSRRGYRAGGTNGTNSAGQPLADYGPEYVTDYEVGAKSDWHVGSIPVRTDADLYYQNYTDIQVNQQTFVNGVLANLAANAGTARIWGAELEGTVELTKELQLGLNFDYLNFEYLHFDEGVNPVTVVGTRTDNRPRYKYGINARYRLPISSQLGELSVQANWTWQAALQNTGTPLVPALPPGAVIDAFGLLNLSVDWRRIENTPLDVSLFVSNATDKVYGVGGFGYYNNLGYSIQLYGEPRMYGIRVRYHLGAG